MDEENHHVVFERSKLWARDCFCQVAMESISIFFILITIFRRLVIALRVFTETCLKLSQVWTQSIKVVKNFYSHILLIYLFIHTHIYMQFFPQIREKANRGAWRLMDLSSHWRITHNKGAISHYPTLKGFHGKIWPQLRGLPSLADRATTLGGVASWPPVMETRSYENERLYGQVGYLEGSSPTWVLPPSCKQFLRRATTQRL